MTDTGSDQFRYPIDGLALLRRKKALRRELLALEVERSPLRVAILSGSTTGDLRDLLELFLLDAGFAPEFYESGYDRGFEEAMFHPERLDAFRPELVYVHTTVRNIRDYPGVAADTQAITDALDAEMERFEALWERLAERYACPLIQNNFEAPPYRILGNLDAVDPRGRTHYIGELNRRFAARALDRPGLHLHDLNYLAARFGLERWHDEALWFRAKYAASLEALPHLAQSLTTIVRAIFGRMSKGLVLDLDNTMWGGVIGEDGPQGIRLGSDQPEGEAYVAFQRYVKELRDRGIVLTVCSKNDEHTALEGIEHPDSEVTQQDFAAFVANWEPKPDNIRHIAETLELGSDSLVFVDDNPMERAAVRAQAPEVPVPEVGDNPVDFVRHLDRNGFFEPATYSADDRRRSDDYRNNALRRKQTSRFDSYDDFLASLAMRAEIGRCSEIYLPRVTQLLNKTNQFNLTTRRVSEAEVTAAASSDRSIVIYGKLSDRFGDAGLISVLVANLEGKTANIDNWVMSCRVLRRGFEDAMLDYLVSALLEKGAERIEGSYIPTAKNGMVKDLYSSFGFERAGGAEGDTTLWRLDLTREYKTRNRWIEVSDGQHSSA